MESYEFRQLYSQTCKTCSDTPDFITFLRHHIAQIENQ